MMNYEEFFKKAFADIRKDQSCPDNEAILNDILERAKRMEKNRQKMHGILTAAAGTAAAVAVIGGSVLGLNWLNAHGGLKEGGVENSNSAGYHEDTSSAYADDNVQGSKDILDVVGDVIEFEDMTATIEQVLYDGHTLRVIYRVDSYDENYYGDGPASARMTVWEKEKTSGRWLATMGGGNTYDKFLSKDNHRNVATLHIELGADETTILTFQHDVRLISEEEITESPIICFGSYTLHGVSADDYSYTFGDKVVVTGDLLSSSSTNAFVEIEQLTVSPLGLKISSTHNFFDDMIFNVDLKHRDGTITKLVDRLNGRSQLTDSVLDDISLISFDDSDQYGTFTSIESMLYDPIDVNDIAAVIINGSEIPLNVYAGMELDNAKELLTKNNISYEVVETAGDDIPKGSIIRTEPELGLLDEKPDNVTLYVSTGTESAAGIDIDDTIEFSDCTVNVSSIERYGNTIKLTLDAYAKENCDIQYTTFIIDETGERAENKNRVPWLHFFDWSDWTEVNADHLQVTFVLKPYIPEGTERTFLLRKGKVTTYDTGETAYFTITGADTSGAYVREVSAVGTGLTGEKMPIDRIEIDPLSISFDVLGFYAFETEFSIKFRDGRIYTYNKEALVRNGRTWEDQDGNIVCSAELDSVHIDEYGDYFEEKNTGRMRYFIIAEEPIFDVNEIESITILGAEIPISAE